MSKCRHKNIFAVFVAFVTNNKISDDFPKCKRFLANFNWGAIFFSEGTHSGNAGKASKQQIKHHFEETVLNVRIKLLPYSVKCDTYGIVYSCSNARPVDASYQHFWVACSFVWHTITRIWYIRSTKCYSWCLHHATHPCTTCSKFWGGSWIVLLAVYQTNGFMSTTIFGGRALWWSIECYQMMNAITKTDNGFWFYGHRPYFMPQPIWCGLCKGPVLLVLP